jgi:uncharacterized protein YbgA (DUF1722 family)
VHNGLISKLRPVNTPLLFPDSQRFKHWFEYFPNNFVWSQQMMSMIFNPADGGSEHCHGDNRVVGANYIADWLMDNL